MNAPESHSRHERDNGDHTAYPSPYGNSAVHPMRRPAALGEGRQHTLPAAKTISDLTPSCRYVPFVFLASLLQHLHLYQAPKAFNPLNSIRGLSQYDRSLLHPLERYSFVVHQSKEWGSHGEYLKPQPWPLLPLLCRCVIPLAPLP